jgi:hypothetical protein
MGEHQFQCYGVFISIFSTKVVLRSKALQNLHHVLLCGRLDVFIAFIIRTNQICLKMKWMQCVKCDRKQSNAFLLS